VVYARAGAIVSERVNLEVNAAILWGKQDSCRRSPLPPDPCREIPLVWDHLNRDDAAETPGRGAQLLRMLGLPTR
jgi:hypothetical protein